MMPRVCMERVPKASRIFSSREKVKRFVFCRISLRPIGNLVFTRFIAKPLTGSATTSS